MMMPPECLIEELRDKNLSELLEERNELIKGIEKLEKIVFESPHVSEAWNMCPGPDVRYSWCHEYLAKLCELIREKYSDQIWNNEECEVIRKNIFYYSVGRYEGFTSDAWVKVFETNGNYYAEYMVSDKEGSQKEEEIEINEETIDKIKEVFSGNRKILEMQYSEKPPIPDGYIDEFVFADGETVNTIYACNLWYYEEKKEEASEDTKLLLDTFKKIRNILIEAGVDEACLKLK